MVKLSIIIPYYQTYELTEKLIKSLIIQNDKENVEIILIDDGCDEARLNKIKYIWSVDNLQIIHQENKGVSSARNKGLELATGEYIAFIDSDDMIMSNYVDTLLDLIDTRNEDIISFNWLDINTNDVVRQPNNPAVWKSIYKREMLPRFDESLKTREDFFFLQELNSKDHTRYFYDKVLYIYNSGRENSLTWKDRNGEL